MSTVEGWIKTQLGEVATLVKGISYASEDYCGVGEGAAFITIKCVSKAGGFKREGIKYFKGSIAPSQVLQPGELLIANTDLTRAGDIVGCPMVVPIMSGEIITMSMDLSKIVEDDAKIDRTFLYYKLMTDSVRHFMKDHASGSTVLHLQTRAVPDLELEIPSSKPEQIKIANILSTVDRAIEQTEALIAKQQRIKTGLMQDLLTRGIDQHGNLRSEQTHKFKDSPLGRIPVEWDVKQLGFLCELIKDGTHLPPARVTEGPLLLGVQNMVDGKLTKTSSDTRVPWDFYEQMHQNWKIQEEDVFLAIVGATIGKTCLAPTNFEPYTLQRSVALIRGKKGILHNRFLLQYLKSPYFQSIIHTKTNSTAQAGLYLSQIADFHFPVCPIEEQIAISSQLEIISNLGDSYQLAGEKLRSLKTALMQDLLTGKKRVTALLNDMEIVT